MAIGNSNYQFKRVLSQEDRDPLDHVRWGRREAKVSGPQGQIIFHQPEVEFPDFWSDMAVNVTASRYFRGRDNSPNREFSLKQLLKRVVCELRRTGEAQCYFTTESEAKVFEDELLLLLLGQYASFNSPVWFNLGAEENPQCSACFILGIEDSLEALLEVQRLEGMLFKYGSGAGSNLSPLRAHHEGLDSGGIASGPVAFMRAFDAWAGTIKSGGKARRAAKMQILDCDHPDIIEFIHAKRVEEEKAAVLIAGGYSNEFGTKNGAYESVFLQNCNTSVRVSDEFMRAARSREPFALRRRTDGSVCSHVDASSMLDQISVCAWRCGDPGLQFDTTINAWHTCPASGRINASNPCSEYMHLDDSACNLASLNLSRFLKADLSFDVDLFAHAIKIIVVAQDILVDRSSYPSPRIAENAKRFRQLGLGFANLGALLMRLGVPYDSKSGRHIASALSALMGAEAYLVSAQIADQRGPFEGYGPNKIPMLSVIEKHSRAADALTAERGLEHIVQRARESWREALELGSKVGFRNAQVTAIAPTGTISFMMDCDTAGIEPDIALVKNKKLVEGGQLVIRNQSVESGLRALGYSDPKLQNILDYLVQNETLDNAPDLREEHLPVFDCALPSLKLQRSISPSGHLLMIACVQPFVSGAISKTINLPSTTTPDEIREMYTTAWELGLKSVSLYRDGSKQSQPMKQGNVPKQTNISTSENVAANYKLEGNSFRCSVCGSSMTMQQGACLRCYNCGNQGACG